MARSRIIVVNPQLGWIQGDLVSATPADAVALMEATMSAATSNPTWDAYVAPAGFPGQDVPYRGDDATLLSMLAKSTPTALANRRVRKAAA